MSAARKDHNRVQGENAGGPARRIAAQSIAGLVRQVDHYASWSQIQRAAAAMRVRAIGADVIEEKLRSSLSRLARCHSRSRVSLVHILIAATRPVVGWLRRPAVVNMLDRITGGIFIALRRASRRGIERAL